MQANGFVKGAVFGMLASAAVCTAMMSGKKASKRSVIGKSLKAVGHVMDDVLTMF